jgi:6-pyruvoyl-tetrahydropterin synthase
METTTTWAKVQTTFTGLHHWKDAPDEVQWLQNTHRHEFHVTVKVSQTHDDRDVEYIMFKRALDEFISQIGEEREDGQYLADKSCEMMATDIAEWVQRNYGNRRVEVEVLEDGENGAVVEANSQPGGLIEKDDASN